MTMTRRLFVCSLVILALSVRAYSDDASAAFNRGARAESEKHYDLAYESYKQAFALKPREAKYLSAYLQSRSIAATEHIKNGQKLRDASKLQEALLEFQRAAQIDATNFIAAEEMRRIPILIEKQAAGLSTRRDSTPEAHLSQQTSNLEGPLELEPSPNSPISLRMAT